MKTIKYLFFCLMDTISFNAALTKDFVIGFIQMIVFCAIFIVCTVVLTWYYGLLITIGCMILFYVLAAVIVMFVNLIKKSRK